MKTYLSRSWISSKLVPGKSRIHGQGVIAAQPIAMGERLMEFGGEIISPDDFETDVYRARSIWQVGEGVYLALREDDPEPSLDENLNHSCDPNAWLDDEVTLVARRDIAAGEEITLDQGTWNFDEDDYAWDQDYCSCGAAQCRNRLTENDWQLADLQARYKGHFHPFILQMIETRRS
jgi:SET domain-containing protein